MKWEIYHGWGLGGGCRWCYYCSDLHTWTVQFFYVLVWHRCSAQPFGGHHITAPDSCSWPSWLWAKPKTSWQSLHTYWPNWSYREIFDSKARLAKLSSCGSFYGRNCCSCTCCPVPRQSKVHHSHCSCVPAWLSRSRWTTSPASLWCFLLIPQSFIGELLFQILQHETTNPQHEFLLYVLAHYPLTFWDRVDCGDLRAI